MHEEADIVIGDGVLTIRRKGSSSTAVARILGRSGVGDEEKIYLDRLIHKPHESELGPYFVSGAVSSILQKTYL